MIGRLWRIVLPAKDLERSVKFYGEQLGLSLKYRLAESEAAFDCGGVELVLRKREQTSEATAEIVLELSTRDIFAAWKQLGRRGVSFDEEPTERSGSFCVPFTDPDGHRLLLVEINWSAHLQTISNSTKQPDES
ncbi:VOC family protein [bacterium]|nr:VOC family protein [bacterium]